MRSWSKLSTLMGASLLTSSAQAVPVQLLHQGRLLDSAGATLQGPVDLTVGLYADAAGGVAVWEEDLGAVSLNEGFFTVRLGESLPLDHTVLNGDALWLAISVDGIDLGARSQLASAPYAVRAGEADHAATADSALTAETATSAQTATTADTATTAETATTATNLDGGVVNATEIRINDVVVINGDGGVAVAASDLTGVLGVDQLPVGDDGSSVAAGDDPRFVSASCEAHEMLTWDGRVWGCAAAAIASAQVTVCSQAGLLRWNDEYATLEVCDGNDWQAVSTKNSGGPCEEGSKAFRYTGGDQLFEQPEGCGTLEVWAWGAGGGGGYNDRIGGAGGYTRAVLSVDAETSMVVVVGQGGRRNSGSSSGSNGPAAYGYGGSPQSGGAVCAVGGGGGLSGLFTGSPAQGTALVIAGGGGGASGYHDSSGGNDPSYAGGQSGLTGRNGQSAWTGAGGGGYQGGLHHVRQTNASYPSGEGGSGFIDSSIASEAEMTHTEWLGRDAPATNISVYPGSGTNGNVAVGYGGRGGVYGQNCDDAGHGAVVVRWSE